MLAGLYGEYNAEVDQQLFKTLMSMYVKDQEDIYQSPFLKKWLKENGNEMEKVSTKLYEETILHNEKKTMLLLKQSLNEVMEFIKKDKTIELYKDLVLAKTIHSVNHNMTSAQGFLDPR